MKLEIKLNWHCIIILNYIIKGIQIELMKLTNPFIFSLVLLLVKQVVNFQFASITVQPDSKIINTVTRYKFSYDRTQDDNLQATNYLTVPITSSDTATITFPNTYTLSTVTCSLSVNGGTQFNPSTCTVSGFKVIATGLVTSNTIVSSLALWITNIVNPSPAITTDYFYGTIGSDTSGSGTFASTVILVPSTFLSCSITFTPNTVNSTADMILTVVPQNSIGSSGSIVVQFPTNRRWTNDISSTNYMPISTSMFCSNKSSNVKSTFQCVGDTTQATVTAANLFNSAVSSSFSFSINNFLSPPTEQPSDAIKITSYISGSQIDTCSAYVSGLSPKPISGVTITSSTGATIVVNKQYLLRFTFTLTDTLSQTDTITINFPASTQLSFSTTTVSSNFSVFPSNATYDSTTLNLYLYMQNQGRTFASGSVLILTIGTYTAPPSIETTSAFTLSIYRNGFIKMQGTATLTASSSTLSGNVSMTSTSVNANTSYVFTITTLDALSPTGKIKIILPSAVSILTSSTTCASVSGAGMAISPVCSFNSVQNSITLLSINSSSSIINAETIIITINGLKNPSSTAPTSSFSVFTYYKSTDSSLVATGTISGVTATTALIDSSKVTVIPSSYVVNDQSTTYSLQLNVVNPIPAGGFFLISIPPEITVSVSSIVGLCSININSTSFVPTVCTSALTTVVVVNFTNPFTTDMPAGSSFIAKISSVFTNPSSTRPTSSFGLDTYHSNGYQIANILASISVQMNTADSFQLNTVTRSSSKNFDIATYTFTIKQKSALEASSVFIITFPSTILPNSPICTMIAPTSASLVCLYSSPNLKITLPVAVSSNVNVVVNVTNIRNPASFAPASAFTLQTKTSGELYLYSYSIYNPGLSNSIATPFESISFQFIPATYGQSTSLTINFNPSNSGVIPSQLRLTFANSFIIQTISCNSFVDFIGTCTSLTPNTFSVSGTFTAAQMSFSVTGFTSPLTSPTDYSSVVTFDSGGYKLDESSTNIIFVPSCLLPCRTCDTGSPTVCSSCYNNAAITAYIYFDSVLKNCYQQCVDGKYENYTSFLCLNCDTNCLTCQTTSTFCITCNSGTLFKYLLINTTLGTQSCVAQCPSAMYPDTTVNPTTCKACVPPCLNCTSAISCLSCVSGYFYYQNQCLSACPTGIAISNPTTNNCDFCDANCLTCITTTTTCNSCNQTLLLYLSKCRTSCPTPLVPQNGTCGSCDSSCKTCVNNPYNCTSCDTASSLPYLFGNLCLSDCPELYYKNIGSGICSMCSSVANLNCANCSSSSTCKTCNIGFVYYEQSCLNYVPTGYVNISGIAQLCAGDCLTCSISTTNCTSCKNLNYYNYQCLANCPSGFIAVSKICTPCLTPCRTCQTTIDTCLSCLTTLDPSLFLSNNQCVETCPNGTYATKTNFTCANCQSPCSYCSSATTCLTCVNGFFLEGTTCVLTCMTGYIGLNGNCLICLGNCATCENSTTTCKSCKSDYYFMPSSSSCVTSCGTGLYIDYLTKSCISCTAPCKTCTNTSDTCLSCTTGVLFNSQCLSQCPEKYFVQGSQCTKCPDNCSSCVSLINCTGCAQNYVLYTGFCILQCPSTFAVVINSVCTKCSTANCHKCTSADFCTNCDSSYSLHNGACLSQCPSGFETNGTDCLDTNQEVLTSSVTFPIPFTIASVVVLIACLMSKLQFTNTFMSGAIYSLIGIIETGSLGYFLYLYFINFFVTSTLPFFVGGAALAYLILLNVLGVIIQNCSLCYDKDFKMWYAEGSHKLATIIVNILSTLINHKFRNILFCKLFSLGIFSAKLLSLNQFKVINVFSFLSLLHSGAAIFAASVAITSATPSTQPFYACIDVIVATGINTILAFFNILKPKDYFYQKTPEGIELKKKINADEEYYQSKIQPAGRAAEDQQGFTTNIFRVQAGTGFTTNDAFKMRQFPQDYQKDYSFGSLMDKNGEQISVQAVEALPQKFDEENQSFTVVFARDTDSNGFLPKQSKINQADISIQSSPMIERGIEGEKSAQRTVYYKQHNYNPYKEQIIQQKGQSWVKASKQKDKKRIFDSSNEEKSEAKKNILYKPAKIEKQQEYKQPQQYKQHEKGSLRDAGVGSFKPITQKSKKDQGIQNYVRTNKKDEIIQRNQARISRSKEQEGSKNKNEIYESREEIKQEPIENIIFDDEEGPIQKNKLRSEVLKENNKQQLILPKQQIQEYEKQLEERIRQNNEKIGIIRRNIQDKERNNNELKAGKLYRKPHSDTPMKQQEKIQVKDEPETIKQQIEVADRGSKNIKAVQFNNSQNKGFIEEIILEDHKQEGMDQKQQQQLNVQKNALTRIKNVVILQPQAQQKITKYSSGQYTSGNDTSTRIQSTGLNFNPKQTSIMKNLGHVNEMQKSVDQQSNGIHEQPVQPKLLNVHTDLSDAVQTFQKPKQTKNFVNLKQGNRQAGQYSQRLQRSPIRQQKIQRYEKSMDKNKYQGRKSSPLKPQVQIEPLAKKNPNSTKNNPLKTINRFQFEQQQRNASQSGDDQSKGNKFIRTHLIAPFETDKEQTQFKSSTIKSPQKVLKPRYSTIPYSTRQQDNEKISKPTQVREKMQIEIQQKNQRQFMTRNQHQIDFGPVEYEQDDQYIYQDESFNARQNQMALIGPAQMLDRPQNDELKRYYEEQAARKKSKQKSKRRGNQIQKQTQKIYLQRQEIPKKWK